MPEMDGWPATRATRSNKGPAKNHYQTKNLKACAAHVVYLNDSNLLCFEKKKIVKIKPLFRFFEPEYLPSYWI